MLNRLIRLTLACSLVALASVTYARAQNNPSNHTTLTFSQPVEVPGKVLPAGTYVFEHHDTDMNRHIVTIYDKSGKNLLTTIMAIPDYRLKATSKTVILFKEVAPGQPQAIRAWFYPGHTVGDELVYSKTRAHELSTSSDLVVPAMDDKTEAKEEPMKAAEVVAVKPDRTELPVSTIQTTPMEPAAVPEPAPAPRAELPHTASNLSTIALFGCGILAIGFALRRFAAPRATR